MIISHIAAHAKNKVIGQEGDLPWDLPEDMAFFRKKTSGHIIVMGRKTFESFPKPLKNRLHVVITRQQDYSVPEGVHVFSNIEKALEFCQSQIPQWPEEVFIIGGGEIYQQTLAQADQLYLTLIDQDYPGDARYPDYEDRFILADRDERFSPQPFSFCLFVKKVDN
jgi:dihydrofolate reductase